MQKGIPSSRIFGHYKVECFLFKENVCVSQALQRGVGEGEGAERERERVPRLEQMPPNRLVFLLRPTDIVDPPGPPPPLQKKKIPQPSVIACASINSL